MDWEIKVYNGAFVPMELINFYNNQTFDETNI